MCVADDCSVRALCTRRKQDVKEYANNNNHAAVYMCQKMVSPCAMGLAEKGVCARCCCFGCWQLVWHVKSSSYSPHKCWYGMRVGGVDMGVDERLFWCFISYLYLSVSLEIPTKNKAKPSPVPTLPATGAVASGRMCHTCAMCAAAACSMHAQSLLPRLRAFSTTQDTRAPRRHTRHQERKSICVFAFSMSAMNS